MTTSTNSTSPADPQGDRMIAEQLRAAASHVIDDLDTVTTARERAGQTTIERLVEAQLMMVQALYHELRHGHDQVIQHTAALVAHTRALRETGQAMEDLQGALRGNTDEMSVRRSSRR